MIVRRGPGEFAERLPDGLEGLRAHNLITFKSHHEALDGWAMLELIGHYVAYRKMVRRSPGTLVPEDQFGLYAVAARFPQALFGQVPWKEIGAGVYDCHWGTINIRVVVAGKLTREPHNALLHLFSAQPALIEFGGRSYRQHSDQTSRLITQLFEGFQGEGLDMPFTMEDFNRQYVRDHFSRLTPKERQEAISTLPPEERLAGLTPEQIRDYLDSVSAKPAPAARKPRRKK